MLFSILCLVVDMGGARNKQEHHWGTSWVVLSLGVMSQSQMMGAGDQTLPQASVPFMCFSVYTSLIINNICRKAIGTRVGTK